MHTVIETPAYRRAAAQAGLTEEERSAVIDLVANDPSAGVEIGGTGGRRKVRFGGRGKGKSGSFRIITFYSGRNIPVFLITVFSKGERSDLSQAERNALAKMTKTLVDTYR